MRLGVELGLAALLAAALVACDASGDQPEPDSDPDSDPGPASIADARIVVDLDEPFDASGLRYGCAIGVGSAGGEGGAFQALEPGGAIPIGGVGQAGLTAKLAYLCAPASDADPALTDAEVELVLTNAFTEVTAPREPKPMHEALGCDGVTCAGARQIEISHLAKLPELEGLTVRVDLRVLSSSDGELLGRDRSHGVLTP